ncbi:GGDEF domain-containing protein [Fusibacter ferrireducens]|uniref:GGDEF domain-containing protein n=1 Tax=Fusibacter ferrireducens TaxID=2785058 RepID=A0ABR9ZPR9_9FIRM|nr:GGDEF domain-containing protein [Fusibacter ferrireducens]MBF4692468.1 GGDEF domain-containing protein [Fusibacter ferrireducens]
MELSDIQLKLYKSSLIVGIILSILSIIGNFISSFPIWISIKWIVLVFILTIALVFSKDKKYTTHMMFGVFAFMIFGFLPFSFANSGGSSNNTIGYIFLFLIAITYLFDGWKRYFLVSALIVMFMIMHIVEYYHPELIAVYSDWNQFVDRMIQIPLLMIMSFLVLLQFAKAYEKANQKMTQYATFDELTGLYNRRMFDKSMRLAIENDNNDDIQLIFIDLDHFKRINDRHGHAIGDDVLKELSGILRNNFKAEKHVVSRWGGDEFAIIYYGDKNELTQKLENVKQLFKDYVSLYEETAGVSMSVVSLKDYDNASQALIDADLELYKEKLKKDT